MRHVGLMIILHSHFVILFFKNYVCLIVILDFNKFKIFKPDIFVYVSFYVINIRNHNTRNTIVINQERLNCYNYYKLKLLLTK